MKVILEIDGPKVSIDALEPVSSDTAIVVKSKLLGELEEAEITQGTGKSVALEVARSRGWLPDGDWCGGEMDWISLHPAPVSVALVGGTVSDELALDYARKAGIEALAVIDQKPMPDEGKTIVAFRVTTPWHWSWPDGSTPV